MSKILSDYINPEIPGAFSGLSGFKKNNNFSDKKIENELFKTRVFTQHVIPRRTFKRRRVIVPEIDDTWQADLVDVQKLKYQNKHFNYILTVIDCFSKYAWAIPIKSKSANDTFDAIKKIIEESNRTPKKLHVDEGNEFSGKFKSYLESKNVIMYATESELKASIVERFNRTIKEKMWRMFTANKNKKYVDLLPQLMKNYNNSYHRSIKNKPSLINKKNERETFRILYGHYIDEPPNQFIIFKYKKGDYVRTVIPKGLFDKGYTIKWSDEIFIIDKQLSFQPPTYKIKALDGEEISKSFYEEQLKKVINEEFPLDTYKVIDTKNNKILVQKLNTSNTEPPFWIEKTKFLNE